MSHTLHGNDPWEGAPLFSSVPGMLNGGPCFHLCKAFRAGVSGMRPKFLFRLFIPLLPADLPSRHPQPRTNFTFPFMDYFSSSFQNAHTGSCTHRCRCVFTGCQIPSVNAALRDLSFTTHRSSSDDIIPTLPVTTLVKQLTPGLSARNNGN